MIAQTIDKESPSGYIRPFALQRDLSALATLIEIGFAEDLAATESHMVQNLRQMALLGPLLWPAAPLLPFAGLVWVEDGQLVGNISFSRAPEGKDTWRLANIAVLPEYRGRGIAGRLVDAAIQHVRQHDGHRILLQVRTDNAAAQAIYQHRGFAVYDTFHEMNLSRYDWPIIVDPPSFPFRRARDRDRAELARLVTDSVSPQLLRIHPERVRRFQQSAWQSLATQIQHLFSGQRQIELVGETNGRIVAYGRMDVRLSLGSHELDLLVLPDERGVWERLLVENLLQVVQLLPRHAIRADISTSHPEALKALGEFGFVTLRVLDQMVLELT